MVRVVGLVLKSEQGFSIHLTCGVIRLKVVPVSSVGIGTAVRFECCQSSEVPARTPGALKHDRTT